MDLEPTVIDEVSGGQTSQISRRHNFFLWDNNYMSHFEGHFEGAKTF